MEIRCVQIIIIYQKEILVLEEETKNKTKITLPLGIIHPGESNLQSAIRSCYEETGIIVTQKDLVKDLNAYTIYKSDVTTTIKPLVFRLYDKQMPVLMSEKISRIYYMRISQFKEKCKYNKELNMIEESIKFLE